MSCVVAVVERVEGGECIVMGSDSAVFDGEHLGAEVQRLLPDGKVFRLGTFGMVVGVVGTLRVLQLVRHSFEPPKLEEGEDLDKYMNTRFVEELRTCLKDAGASYKHDETEYSHGVIVVGFRGRIYVLYSDFSVARHGRFFAVGSGADVALGVLYACSYQEIFAGSPSAEATIRRALNAAQAFNSGVSEPFHVVVGDVYTSYASEEVV